MNIVDLHVHSNKSDGSYTPSELVDYALEKGLSAFALTDHDTTDGLDEAIRYAKGKDIEVIPGIELSTEYRGKDIHIVGLFIDHRCEAFQSKIQEFRDARIYRNIKMCQNLQKAGIDITYEKLTAEFPESVITRSHYAKYLLKYGYIKNLKEAFDRYVGDHCKYFVPREKITPVQAVSLILESGGIPVLAHPILYHMTNAQLDELVASLKESGLIGIEAIYSTYSPADERQIRELAAKYDLAISGGSDFHGTAKPGLELATGYGKLFIPEDVLTGLKEHAGKTSPSADSDGKPIGTLHSVSPAEAPMPSILPTGIIAEDLKHNASLSASKSLEHPSGNCSKTNIQKKIFFTDLDGTLLNDEKKVTPKTSAALQRWLDCGNVLAVSSGRPIGSILQVIKDNKIGFDPESGAYHDNLYAIAFNGALTYHVKTGTVRDQVCLKPETVRRIAEIVSSHGVYCQAYDESQILVPRECPELEFYRRTVRIPYKVLPDFPASIAEPPYKFLCICLELTQPDRLTEVAEDIMSEFPEDVTCVKSSPYLLEVFSSTSGKGSAVKKLCEGLGIPASSSFAAGDQQNDLSMLQAAGCGIAMCNGTEDVKAAADKVTASTNNEDGLVPFLLQA